tara:strand:+ start:239 stop:2347 length:2109 start_codon:yes stop_codon:yes gene_type:complete
MSKKEKNQPLAALFEPKSIAIVGASEDASRMGGGLIMRFLDLHDFGGIVYPVNPKYESVNGLTCFSSLADIPEPVDLAVLSVPAKIVRQTVDALTPGQVKCFLIITSGFGELGEEGKRLEHELVDLIHDKGGRAVGPNSVGSINLWNGAVPSITQLLDRQDIEAGNVALASQSGAVGAAILTEAERQGIGTGHFVSSGNEADLEFSDYARYLIDDEQVGIIGGYIESIRKGESFIGVSRAALEAGKPLIILKVGKSDAGAIAAQSHTGALVGSDAVAQAVFDSSGVIRAADGDQFIDFMKVFNKTPISHGKRIALVSHSGGAGVLAADAATEAGLNVVALPEELREQLAGILPDYAGFNNPLDATGPMVFRPDILAQCLRLFLASNHYDAAVLSVKLIWRNGLELIEELTKLRAEVDKPFAVSWVAPHENAMEAIRKAPFPVFSDPARATRNIATRLLYDERRRVLIADPQPSRDNEPSITDGASIESVAHQKALLEAYGIRLPREIVAETIEEAEEFRLVLDNPVAVKIASPDIAHRTEIGGVVTDVRGEEALAVACDTVNNNARRHYPNAQIEGVLVQEMVSGGLEVLIGIKRDPVFGPMIAFGPGGTLVELIGDVNMLPCPVSESVAYRILEESVLGPLFKGFRGTGPLDLAALASTIARVSWLAADRPEIMELDLNPVVVLAQGEGCVAVDYKFSVGH